MRLREVVAQIRRVARQFEVVVVEGAGGLLSPMGKILIRAISSPRWAQHQ